MLRALLTQAGEAGYTDGTSSAQHLISLSSLPLASILPGVDPHATASRGKHFSIDWLPAAACCSRGRHV